MSLVIGGDPGLNPDNPFIPAPAQAGPTPFLASSLYNPVPRAGGVPQAYGPVINVQALTQQLTSQPLPSTTIINVNSVSDGTVSLVNGSASNLPLKFSSSPGNGMYLAASNDWYLVAGGIKVLRLQTATLTIDASVALKLSSLTASRLVASDASKNLVSANASSFVIGTTNQIVVTPSSGTVILSTPQDIDTGASVTFEDLHLTDDLQVDGDVGFNGATPVAQPAAYTLNYNTTTRTLNAYTSNGQGSAYTGIDNLQVGTVYATVADLNTLRVAYENLRASYDNSLSVWRQVLGDLITYNLLQ